MGDSNTDGVFIFPIFNIGYRYQKPSGGFIFRANVGALSTGLSLGYAFLISFISVRKVDLVKTAKAGWFTLIFLILSVTLFAIVF